MLLCIILHILFYCYYVTLKNLKMLHKIITFFNVYNVAKNIEENKYIK